MYDMSYFNITIEFLYSRNFEGQKGTTSSTFKATRDYVSSKSKDFRVFCYYLFANVFDFIAS